MRALAELAKSLLIGGFLFLLPLGVIIIIFGKLLSIARQWGDVLQNWLFPSADSPWVVLSMSALILMVIALLAGVFARTTAGKRTFGWFERVLLSRLPFYTLIRQIIPDTDSEPYGDYKKTPVVTVRLDDQILLGLVVDTTPKGRKIVYLPSAPTALSGSVVIVDADRIEETGIKPREFLAGLRRLGTGMARLEKK